MKKFAVLLLALIIPMCFSNGFAEEDGWRSAYADAIRKYGNEWGNIYVLNDFDVDGTPELVLGSYPGSGLFSGVEKIFTYKNNSLTELTDNDTLIDTEYNLYQNYGSGDLRIEGTYAVRAGWMGHTVVDGEYYLDNGLQFIPKFEKSTTRQDKNGNIIETYNYYVNRNETSEANYNREKENYYIGWLKVNSYKSASYSKHKKLTNSEINEFLNSYEDGPAITVPSKDNITLDGGKINPNIPAGYNIADRNYYKLRDIAMALNGSSAQFEIEWKNNAIYIETGKEYTSVGGELTGTVTNQRNLLAEPNDAPVYIDGAAVSLKSYNINGNNYFQVRDLGSKLGFGVDYDTETSTVLLSTKLLFPLKGPITNTDYSATLPGTKIECDFVAREPLPLYAPGNGTVEYIQVSGNVKGVRCLVSYGNQLYFTTEYQGKTVTVLMGHLSSFNADIDESKMIPSTQTAKVSTSPTSKYYNAEAAGSRQRNVLLTKEVKAGELLGYTGETGNAHGPHLHMEVKVNGSYVDPRTILGERQ